VYTRLALSTIDEVNIKDSFFSFVGVLTIKYSDERLNWANKNISKFKLIEVSSSEIFKPDIIALPQAGLLDMGSSGSINNALNALLHSNGTIVHSYPVKIKIPYK